MKKYWIIKNLMYSAYEIHEITNVFFGTWYEAARLCVENTGCQNDPRSVKLLDFNHKKSESITYNYI